METFKTRERTPDRAREFPSVPTASSPFDEKHGDSLTNRIFSPNALPQDNPLKVGLVSYPTLFQNEGGLQVQVRETQVALEKLGIDVKILDTTRDDFSDFNIIHVFSVQHGNVKLVEQARAKGCKVVLSSLLNPAFVIDAPLRLALIHSLESLISRISGYKVKTDLRSVHSALSCADHIIALGNWERDVINKSFGTGFKRVSVVPNGISKQFFESDKAAFHAEYDVTGPFVFYPGQISSWKNQLTLVRALAGTNITVVLAGPLHGKSRATLDACLAVPAAKVVYLGNLDRTSPTFSGAYAAASALVMPSKAEAAPLVALESLAAGTPAIITRDNGLDLQPDGYCLRVVDPFDVRAIRETVLEVLADRPDPMDCRAKVESMSWDRVAVQIANIYSSLHPAYTAT